MSATDWRSRSRMEHYCPSTRRFLPAGCQSFTAFWSSAGCARWAASWSQPVAPSTIQVIEFGCQNWRSGQSVHHNGPDHNCRVSSPGRAASVRLRTAPSVAHCSGIFRSCSQFIRGGGFFRLLLPADPSRSGSARVIKGYNCAESLGSPYHIVYSEYRRYRVLSDIPNSQVSCFQAFSAWSPASRGSVSDRYHICHDIDKPDIVQDRHPVISCQICEAGFIFVCSR